LGSLNIGEEERQKMEASPFGKEITQKIGIGPKVVASQDLVEIGKIMAYRITPYDIRKESSLYQEIDQKEEGRSHKKTVSHPLIPETLRDRLLKDPWNFSEEFFQGGEG
jgi:hypothetical protein